MTEPTPSADLSAVQRWQATGGEVEIVDDGDPMVVALCSCDGHQEMQRIISTAADRAPTWPDRPATPPLGAKSCRVDSVGHSSVAKR